ncbi:MULTISPECIES: fluoride efflux transporter CrcB [unclassified Paenibacillus]|uniref:fluoride efflux transporter CrcB n=1 Tax=unclassified Paenibacillus TaxID=185978 RepID=UPI0009553847|nr:MULTISPECIES: fluoride efflux transporter CrcB [unclassified Paenibacillus]ASS68620.2 fluoride efflux transporter CrcB [Paenibacillus sp. RUD330]SIR64817.1 CrcB protein [Paenibacillus sp. RU4X]SIR72773.1 CrcB protein [Paenibacillus sp. RU4T]
MIYLLMGIGGMLGALLRYSLGEWIGTGGVALFPLGTLIVNFAGCFVLAFFYAATTTRFTVHPHFRSSFGTGFVGSFTTFSAFSREMTDLMGAGHLGSAALYAAGSLLGGFLATAAGVRLGTLKHRQTGEERGA